MKPMRINESVLASLKLEDYVLEKKYDGFRALLVIENEEINLMTRQKTEIVIPDNLRLQIASLNLPDGTVLDGEIWTPTKRGSWVQNKNMICSLTFWDAMVFHGNSIRNMSLQERRSILEELIRDGTEDIQIVEQEPVTRERINEIRKDAMEHRKSSQSRSGYVHGVVLKRKKSPRRDHAVKCTEHPDWMKIVFT